MAGNDNSVGSPGSQREQSAFAGGTPLATLIDHRPYIAGTLLYPSASLRAQTGLWDGVGQMGEVCSSRLTKAKGTYITKFQSPGSGPIVHSHLLTLAFLLPLSLIQQSQSLLHSSISSHQSSSRSLESPTALPPASTALVQCPCIQEPVTSRSPAMAPQAWASPEQLHSPPLAKEHASSCPPSITNSMVDIPIVLINGFPEPGSP